MNHPTADGTCQACGALWVRGRCGAGCPAPSAQPVDVLAVMDAAAWGTDVPEHREAIQDARAAVAELIEADKANREALETCERWFAKHSPTAPLINGKGEAEHPMLTMLRAALARVQGGAA